MRCALGMIPIAASDACMHSFVCRAVHVKCLLVFTRAPWREQYMLACIACLCMFA